jgi:outer membrane protein insertion porin family
MKKEKLKIRFLFIILSMVLVVPLWGRTNQKYKIKSIRFDGNTFFSDRQLRRAMASRRSSFLNPSAYYPDILYEDLKTLERFYHQHGFLEACISSHKVVIDSSRKKVSISIDFSEGERTFVEGVGVFGNSYFSKDVLFKQIKIRNDAPFLKDNLESSTLALLKLYANSGFLDTRIDPSIQLNTDIHRAIIDFIIRENNQFTIDEIHLIGLKKTRPRVVLREILFKRGDMINYTKLLESQRQIYLTSLFQNVFIHPKNASNGDSTQKDIDIEMKENMSIEFNVAAGYGTVEKLRGRIEIINTNLGGMARRAGLAAKVSFVQYGAEISFTEPYTLGSQWRTDAKLYAGYKKEPGYSMDHIRGELAIGRSFSKRSNMTVTYREEHAKLYDIKVLKIPEDVKTNVKSLKLSFIHDTRNNLFNPSRGFYIEWSNELGGTFSAVINGFLRSMANMRYFIPLSNSTVFATAFEIGWINVSGGLQAIPLQERFYIGGPNSVRGFKYKKLGPLDENGVPIGGRFKIQWNIFEVRQRLYQTLGLVFFTDLGNVWSKPEDFNISEMRVTPGLGIRINTPIGVARLDLGINPKPRNQENGHQWIFGIGQVF